MMNIHTSAPPPSPLKGELETQKRSLCYAKVPFRGFRGLGVIVFLLSALTLNAQAFLSIVPTTGSLVDAIQSDTYIKPKSGIASEFQPGEGIELSFDGNMNTMYHSRWMGATTFPVTLDYQFDATVSQKIDYAVYYPRQTGTNGHFIEVEVWYAADGKPLTKYKDYNFGGAATPSTVVFEPAIVNPETIRFVVKSGTGDGQGNYVACAEMEFYRKTAGFDYRTVFADATCSELKSGITIDDIKAIEVEFYRKLASEIFYGVYNSENRIQEYIPYRPINALVSELKTSTYNSYENPTGIWVEPGNPLVVFVSDTKGENISLNTRDWDTDGTRSYTLRTGINHINPTMAGNENN